MHRTTRNILLVIFFCLLGQPLAALEPYYGKELASKERDLAQTNLKSLLYKVLSSAHVQSPGEPDQFYDSCPNGKECLKQISLGYTGARRVLFGQLYLHQTENGYAVEDIYCSQYLSKKDFPKGKGPGPDQIPDTTVINAEHSWPQSKFSRRFPANLQKADLHILFSTSSRANSLRGNEPFGDVITLRKQVCAPSQLGFTSRSNHNHFLPPAQVRGDLARAVFYFSTRYQMSIDPEEEESLRHWHHQDPVDATERERHDIKFTLTQIRNPYIDHPEWVDLIADF